MKKLLTVLVMAISAATCDGWGVAGFGGTRPAASGDTYLSDYLIGYWKMDEASNTDRVDSINGNTAVDAATAVAAATGKIGDGADFQAINSEKLTITDNAAFSWGGKIAISIWVKPGYSVAYKGILTKQNLSTGTQEFSVYQRTDGFGLQWVSSGGSGQLDSPTMTITEGAWYNVIAFADGYIFYLYVNGIEKDSAAYNGTITETAEDLYIGAVRGMDYYEGVIDEVGIWGNFPSLSTPARESFVAAIYNSGAGRNLDEIQGTVPAISGLDPATDTTAGGATVTITGTGFSYATAVYFGADAATGVTINSATEIECTASAHAAGTVLVTVTNAVGTSPDPGADAADFVYSDGANMAATGGIISTDGTYKYHKFLESGTFEIVSDPVDIEVLLVAGGGGGGNSGAGGQIRGSGGGAGGLLYYGAETPKTPDGAAITPSVDEYAIVVGTGGAANTSGANTTGFSKTAVGGGAGTGADGTAGSAGGSGGGGWYGGAGGAGTADQGNAGGSGSTDSRYGGGGGGGAGAAGTNGSDVAGGNGGNGLQYSISGTAAYYAGGGSGDVWEGTGGVTAGGTAGLGGGGTGDNFTAGGNGTDGLGGGGGGGGGIGGSGVVIIRYAYDDSSDPTAVYSVTPATDSTAGGAEVVIAGIGFTSASAVTFGGTAATSYTVDTDRQITATAPAHAAGTVKVEVVSPDGTSADTAQDDFVYVTPPPTEYYATGCGDAFVNGTYVPNGTVNGKGAWKQADNSAYLEYDGYGSWLFSDTSSWMPYHTSNSSDDYPPTTGWSSAMGTPPAPTVTHN